MQNLKYIVLFSLIFSFSANSASWQITYPRPALESSTSDDYPLMLLSLALAQTGVNYELKPSEKHLSQGKTLNRLRDNREINIVWSMTDEQREQDLLPIRIPIYKGLIGWRLLLIRNDMVERFKYINKLEHMVKLNPLQGSDWPDTKILQSNGFDVITAPEHDTLFDMVLNAQGDFYPRSLVEIWGELEGSPHRDKLQAQSSLGIRYSAAAYFFVNKKSVPLANLIKTGLEKAIANGKFDALFMETYGKYIEQANIEGRQFFQLENSFLPAETPLQRKELWFNGSDILE